jgi:predicted nucleic-acid-binding protein
LLSAIDTNILVRLIAQDDERQLAIVEQLLNAGQLHANLSVVLETEWVLRSRYGYDRERIYSAFSSLLDVEGLEFEFADVIEWALGQYRLGADFGDMIHLAAAREADRFLTFDRALASSAGQNTPVAIETI